MANWEYKRKRLFSCCAVILLCFAASVSAADKVTVTGNITKIVGDISTDMMGYTIRISNKAIAQKRASVVGDEIVLPIPATETTDSTGAFSVAVWASDEYTDSTSGFYSVACLLGKIKIWELESVWLTGDIDVKDSLGASR